MKASPKRDISETLRRLATPPEPRAADAFWEEFRARAAMTDQLSADRTARVSRPWNAWHAGLAAAAALVLVALLAVVQLTDETVVATADTGTSAPLSDVEEVEIFADYTSMLIVEDQKNGGTLIWVAGTEVASVP